MKINSKFNIGQPVKIIANIAKDGNTNDKITCEYGYISEIVIRKCKISGDIYIMYRFSNNNCLYSESSLQSALF